MRESVVRIKAMLAQEFSIGHVTVQLERAGLPHSRLRDAGAGEAVKVSVRVLSAMPTLAQR